MKKESLMTMVKIDNFIGTKALCLAIASPFMILACDISGISIMLVVLLFVAIFIFGVVGDIVATILKRKLGN